MKIQTVNPATEQIIQNYDCLNEQHVNERLNKAHETYLAWKITSFNQRKNFNVATCGTFEI